MYDAFRRIPLVVIPLSPKVICFVSDRRFDWIWLTTPNCGYSRDPKTETAPVAGTIALAGAYTGRFPSLASANLGTVSRLMSIEPV